MSDWESIFIQHKIIWEYPGHGPHAEYLLSKKHSNFYFNSNFLVCNPPLLKEVGLALFKLAKPKSTEKPDWIVAYPPFGLNIGFCLAELFQCQFAYLTSSDPLDVAFAIQPNDTVLFCADDLLTGGCFLKILQAIESKGAKLIGPLAVIANFSGSSVFRGYDVVSLMQRDIPLWGNDCPLCAAGSLVLPARQHWDLLTK